jgi:hypothetical protein
MFNISSFLVSVLLFNHFSINHYKVWAN